MATETLRPDATAGAGGSSIGGGAGSRHAATSDDSDSTYVQLGTTNWLVEFAEPSASDGFPIKRASLRIRAKKSGGSAPKLSGLFQWGGTEYDLFLQTVNWSSITTTTPEVVEPIDAADVHDFTLGLAYEGSGPAGIRIYELYLDLVYVTDPVVNADGPTGTPDGTSPIVTWTPTLDPDGGPQTAARVRVFSAAQYGIGGFNPLTSPGTADSDLLTGAGTSWQVDETLADGTYRAYVWTAQTVNGELILSDPDFTAFTISADRPAVPTLLATAQDSHGRIQVDATAGGGGDVATTHIEIQRSVDGGTTWEAVRSRAGVDTDTFPLMVPDDDDIVSIWDHEAPNGRPVLYRARAAHDFVPGYSYSAWSGTTTGQWDGRLWYLTPADGTDGVAIDVHSNPGRGRSARQSVSWPMGRKFPIVVDDSVRPGPTGQVVFRVDDDDAREELEALLDRQVPLLMRPLNGQSEPDRWVRIGDQGTERIADKGFVQPTFESLPWVEVERPDGEVSTFPDGPAADDPPTEPEEEVILL